MAAATRRNWAFLGRRLLTGAILASCAVVAVEAGGVVFLAVVTALAVIVTFEWIKMSCRGQSRATLIVSIVTALASAIMFAIWDGEKALIAGVVGTVLVGLVARFEKNNPILVAAGVAIFALSLISTYWLRIENGTGLVTVYLLFVVVWATDSGAYLIGSFLGGARIAPRISPGKTWAGAAGGFVFGILFGIALTILLVSVGMLAEMPNLVTIAAASALFSLFAQFGDLAESSVKRLFGVKDSGSLLPGHGGALDRLDSLIFVAPLLALAVFLAGGSGRLLWAGG
ncbi:MAG: phosphatidate cytidylyltransferase [Proteobacteria bacterium]|nr:phosphatidate cytidylyltransferase [Pseudomonadota bacterium]MDA1355950.1 phosphatidate cytidylyltransferase [Pseudomonadota bacterium]